MDELWKMPSDAVGLTGFTRDLGGELERALKIKHPNARVYFSELDKTNGHEGWMLQAYVERGNIGEIMITPRQEAGKGTLTIDRFLGIKLPHITRYFPDSLITIANAYEEVTSFLDSKFGQVIGSQDGRDIYEASINQKKTMHHHGLNLNFYDRLQFKKLSPIGQKINSKNKITFYFLDLHYKHNS